MLSLGDVARRQLTRVTGRIYSLPVVILMPHGGCNCRCVMCDIWKANHDRRQLTREDLARQMETFRTFKVQRVVLSGGEALMHPNLWTLCALLKELSLKITLLSTGLRLERNAPDVIHWTDDVVVSLDGSPAVHDRIRNVPRAFDRLAEGVRALKCHATDFPVRARCVVQRHNFADLPNVVTTAHRLGLNQISFLAADVSSTAFNRQRPWDAERVADVALNPKEASELEGIVERLVADCADDFATGFIAESPEKLRRIPRYYRAISGDGDFPETVCNAPWVSTVVEADGTVRPCFFHAALGNLQDQPLEAILNSADALDFRRRLDVRRDPICRKCVCTLNLGPRAAP